MPDVQLSPQEEATLRRMLLMKDDINLSQEVDQKRKELTKLLSEHDRWKQSLSQARNDFEQLLKETEQQRALLQSLKDQQAGLHQALLDEHARLEAQLASHESDVESKRKLAERQSADAALSSSHAAESLAKVIQLKSAIVERLRQFASQIAEEARRLDAMQ